MFNCSRHSYWSLVPSFSAYYINTLVDIYEFSALFFFFCATPFSFSMAYKNPRLYSLIYLECTVHIKSARLYTTPVFDCSETCCLPACWCVCSIGQRHQTLNHQFLIFSYRRAFFSFYYYCRARRIIRAVDRVLSCLSEPSTHLWFVMYKVGNHFSAQFVFYARSSSSLFLFK